MPTLVLITVFCFAADLSAQTSRSRTAVPQSETRAAAEAVSIQIKNMSRFLFVMGGVAKGIDDLDKEINAGRASADIRAQNRQFKEDVIRSVRALRAGVVNIERDFIAKPGLRQYLTHIRGVSEESAIAEDLALEGKFNASGRQLVLIVERLSDLLVELP
ncbi:MAG: hypothetical protein DWQ38_11500 [Acidobacteria bacterium]|nr:MAG: hypothetical protein DWQ38_11500 [Acidobacteriota bacterium]